MIVAVHPGTGHYAVVFPDPSPLHPVISHGSADPPDALIRPAAADLTAGRCGDWMYVEVGDPERLAAAYLAAFLKPGRTRADTVAAIAAAADLLSVAGEIALSDLPPADDPLRPNDLLDAAFGV